MIGKETLFHFGKYIFIGCFLGLLFGTTRSVFFESSPSGKYAEYKVCDDWESDDRGGETCSAYHMETSTLGERAKNQGTSYALTFGFIAVIFGLWHYESIYSSRKWKEKQKQMEKWKSEQNLD